MQTPDSSLRLIIMFQIQTLVPNTDPHRFHINVPTTDIPCVPNPDIPDIPDNPNTIDIQLISNIQITYVCV